MDRARLLRAFEVTEHDVAVNRKGELTDRQRQAVRRAADSDAGWMLGMAIVLGVVMYGIGGYLFHDGRVLAVRTGSDVLGVLGIVFATVLLPTSGIVWAGYTVWIASRARGPLTVKSFVGPVEMRRIAYKQSEIFELTVEGQRFDVGPAVFEALESGARYRVHVIPEISTVISIEPGGE